MQNEDGRLSPTLLSQPFHFLINPAVLRPSKLSRMCEQIVIPAKAGIQTHGCPPKFILPKVGVGIALTDSLFIDPVEHDEQIGK